MLGWFGSTGFNVTRTSWSQTECFAGEKSIWRAKKIIVPDILPRCHPFSCFADVLIIKLVLTNSFAHLALKGMEGCFQGGNPVGKGAVVVYLC